MIIEDNSDKNRELVLEKVIGIKNQISDLERLLYKEVTTGIYDPFVIKKKDFINWLDEVEYELIENN